MFAPGTVILLAASCFVQGHEVARTQTAVVVANPAITRRVYAPRWDRVLAGVKVRLWEPGWGAPVDGVATNDGRVCVGGELME